MEILHGSHQELIKHEHTSCLQVQGNLICTLLQVMQPLHGITVMLQGADIALIIP